MLLIIRRDTWYDDEDNGKVFDVFNLGTVDSHYAEEKDIIKAMKKGVSILNAKLKGNKLIVNDEAFRGKDIISICEYGDYILNLDISQGLYCEYRMDCKKKYSDFVLPAVSNEVLDSIKELYTTFIKKSTIIGSSNEFDYVVLDKENVIMTKFKGTTKEIIVPKFINSIGVRAIEADRKDRVTDIKQFIRDVYDSKIDKIILHNNVKNLDYSQLSKYIENKVKELKFGVVEVM